MEQKTSAEFPKCWKLIILFLEFYLNTSMQGPTKKKLNWRGLINYYIANLIILLKKNIMVVKKK